MKELHHDNYPSQSEMQEWLFQAAAHQPSGGPSHGGERHDHPLVAEYAESEQAYSEHACRYSLQGKRGL